jgi:hypothetical protein
MDEIISEIKKVSSKIDAVEQLLKKPFNTWSDEEKDEFGNHKYLRKEEELLRRKEEQLRKEKEQHRDILILERNAIFQRNQNQGIAMDIDSNSQKMKSRNCFQ